MFSETVAPDAALSTVCTSLTRAFSRPAAFSARGMIFVSSARSFSTYFEKTFVRATRYHTPTRTMSRSVSFFMRRLLSPLGFPGHLRHSGLRDRANDDLVDVDVSRPRERPQNAVGDVVGGERLDASVDLVGFFPGAPCVLFRMEADDR